MISIWGIDHGETIEKMFNPIKAIKGARGAAKDAKITANWAKTNKAKPGWGSESPHKGAPASVFPNRTWTPKAEVGPPEKTFGGTGGPATDLNSPPHANRFPSQKYHGVR